MTTPNRHTAEYWHREGNDIRCDLCPHRCRIVPGETGRCLARRNIDGKLVAEGYGKITSIAVVPHSKKAFKPLLSGKYHLNRGFLRM